MSSKPSKPARAPHAGAAPSAPSGTDTHPGPVRTSLQMKLGVLVFVVAIALGGYAVTGSPDLITGPPPTAGTEGPMNHQAFGEAVDQLAERLKADPGNAEGWSMLGRSYMVMGRYAEAKAAYQQLAKLVPNEAGVYADLADAAAMAAGRKLAGEPTALIERALELDPDHRKSLALAGSAAFDRGDYAAAARYWDRIADLEPPGSESGQQARAGADEARKRGNLPPRADAPLAAATGRPAAPTQTPARPPAASPAAAGAISGTVTLADALKSRASPDDTVFIFARPAEGSRVPLAVLRRKVSDLPADFSLDDSMAMNPGAGISSVSSVVVGARVSKSGQPVPQPGDLEGLSAPVKVGASGLKIEISRALP
jgi:cytochrome c-type biogenesis protein CcmH